MAAFEPGKTRQVTFPGSTGAKLAGVLHVPDGPVAGSVLMAHCFTCSKNVHTMTRLSGGLCDAGFAVLRFDFTGIGDSGGDFSGKTVSNNVRDLVAAATALIREGFGPCGLLGHSLGGAACLLAARRLKTVRSVVVLGAPATPSHVRRLFIDAEDQIAREGQAMVSIAGRSFPISRGFVEDLDQHDQGEEVAALGRPLLVIHAVDDEVVEVAQGERIFAEARQPKAFHPLLNADHLLTRRQAADEVVDVASRWFLHTLET